MSSNFNSTPDVGCLDLSRNLVLKHDHQDHSVPYTTPLPYLTHRYEIDLILVLLSVFPVYELLHDFFALLNLQVITPRTQDMLLTAPSLERAWLQRSFYLSVQDLR